MPSLRPAKPPVALTVAGFDPSSGAGITADLAAFAAHGLFGTSAITVLTVQSTLGVAATEALRPTLLEQTLAHLAKDILPQGIKIGALGTPDLAEKLFFFLGEHPGIPVVFDPVFVSSSGKALFPVEAMEPLHEGLMRRVSWITPNWRELALLSEEVVRSLDDAGSAAEKLSSRHPHLNIVATGGDQEAPVDFVRFADGRVEVFEGQHIVSNNTHGTGCAFSSALLSRLVLGYEPAESVKLAKEYVAEAIRRAPGIGNGKGPLNLMWPLRRT
ncbi:bifunctional hydroxymethylpyrimidine kinase/phosphomethylpyrimidine kinase [Granulicella cerasi]|uniref:hydroxymethylpyrimidine kinase n=1 Tax=Granulicella cerasi TaxID=741063 RepID=A0ABW1Z5I8_9BACT|nr:bifunctional hydroxymethylpyrimidine kinase/phosphomethylpyrimidine kinase [Granulicella cerasi]